MFPEITFAFIITNVVISFQSSFAKKTLDIIFWAVRHLMHVHV